MASSSSSHNWLYDVFLSFRGEDIRVTFRSHFLKELNRKLITAFKDNEIKKSHSLWPELVQAIMSSRIAVVIFSKNYASSSWCLNELLEIVNCKDKIVIPIFYGVVPSDVRKQTGDFGKIFEETCKNNTEEVKNQWKKALTDVANMLGFDSAKWDDEAKMIEKIADDVLGKLLSTSSKDFENSVGIEDHMAKMSELLQLESEEVRMVGIWGSSGIGKTTIARALFNQLPQHFQVSKFLDRSLVSKSKEIYSRANPDDYNMKLHIQEQFLSEILGIKDIKIGHLGAVEERLQNQKVLIIIDDLDDLMVLNVLAGKTQWFGSGSRIIVVTNNRRFLRAHRINHIYEVGLPTEVQACQMLCQSAFGKNYAPEGFEKLVVEVTRHVGSLPLCLNVLGKYLQGQDEEYWMDMVTELQNGLDDEIEKILRISYDGLDSKEKAIFRHIACLFNHMEEKTIKSLLANSNLGVNIALQNLADKSLIHVRQGYVVMHSLLEKLGKKINTQSSDKPGEREFLVDSKDICYVLTEGNGTQKVLGISLNINEIDELHIHESAFKGMHKLRFLEIDSESYLHVGTVRLHESFDYLPLGLKLLCWPIYPMSRMPSNFCPKNLVKLKMCYSELEKLWEGVVSLPCLKEMDLRGSEKLTEVPDLSKATNLETLDFGYCRSLREFPSSIRYLNKLLKLNMTFCQLETLPTGFNLESLEDLRFAKCLKLRTFPEFATNISFLDLGNTNIEEFPCNLNLENLVQLGISKEESDENQWDKVKPLTPFIPMLSPTLTELYLWYMPNLVELPSSFKNLNQLKRLTIMSENLETLPTGINLKSLEELDLAGCSRLRSFPEISTNISQLDLSETGIEEVPWWIENFSNLTELYMRCCSRLKCVSLHISKLKHLDKVDFSECEALTRVDLSGYSSEVAMEAENIDTVPEEADDYIPKAKLDFMGCFNLDQEALLQQQSVSLHYMLLPGEEVPSYFTHRTTGYSSLTIPLLHIPLSQPFFRFRVCAVVTHADAVAQGEDFSIYVKCEFKGRFGNSFDYGSHFLVWPRVITDDHMLAILDCRIPLNADNAPLAQWNYDHVDMKIHAPSLWYKINHSWDDINNIRGWGIQLSEDCTSLENRLGYPNTLPHDHCEADEDNIGYMPLQGLVNETADSNVETERSRKGMRI